ncbi:MAG: 5'-deoxyadenosine deaminase [Myxococcales bacterium]|jgi:5-methylthioadenosine/S-adenosylhomocysteine deaminase
MGTLIQNGNLVTMDPQRRVLRGDLRIEDGRIAAIAPSLEPRAGEKVIDATDRAVVPGFVQAHVHLCQTLLRNRAEGLELLDWLEKRVLPLEAAHDERSMAASADLGIAELLKGGTTAILDMGTVRLTEVIFERAAAAGIRYVGGKAMMDLPRRAPAGLRETTRQSIDEAVALLRRYHGAEAGRLGYAFAPRFVLSCTEELLRETALRARELGARLHTHASENPTECQAVREKVGADNVEYLERIGLTGPDVALAHCVWLNEREERILAESGTHLAHCPSSNLKLASGIARVPELMARGVRVALGADGAPCNNNLDAFTEMRLASLIHRPRAGALAMSAETILEMATIAGARALGLEGQIGSIEVGKRADLVVVDLTRPHCVPSAGDPIGQLVYCAHASDVEAVFVDGRSVVESGELVTLDEEKVVASAREQAPRLTARAGV